MTADEWERWWREQVERYGLDVMAVFPRFLASRQVAATPPRTRGYAGPLFTHGASTTRTRLSNCQRERNR